LPAGAWLVSAPEASNFLTGATGARWTVHDALEADDPELLVLFEEVFGHGMSLEQWRWKYAGTALRGTLLRRQGVLVGFFGGMPRPVQGPDRLYTAVQNGDVMVKPGERGVFTRHGAFYCVTAAFLDRYIGPGRRYEFGIGFPNQRHLSLGVKLGLYIQGDRMKTISWSPLPADSRLRWSWSREGKLEADRLGAVDALWRKMRADWTGWFIPVRNAARWRYRFLAHPAQGYELLLITRRLDGAPLAAVALREHPGHVEWLDYVGPRSQVRRAVLAARRFAGAVGAKPLTALCSESIAPLFAADAAAVEESSIAIPLRVPEPGWHQPYPWQGKLWLMGGDTDFL
jgi:hypothetical protein